MSAGSIIAAERLRAVLEDRAWVIVDCRFELGAPDAGYAAYLAGHIPGARYAHLEADLSAAPAAHQGRHPLPEPAAFAATLGRLGVAPSSRVVAYDDAGGAVAARLWWLLRWLGHERVCVLDGGLTAWRAAGFELEPGLPAWRPEAYPPRAPRDGRVTATSEIPRCLAAGDVLVDARSAERFLGRSEPIDPVAGHVPGAVNFPFQRSLGPDSRFLEPAGLRRRLETALGTREADRIVAMCGSGVTACHLLLALDVAGLGEGRLYAGSWSEWIRDPDRPAARG